MMLVWTYGALVFFAMSFSMGSLLLRLRSTRIPTEGNISDIITNPSTLFLRHLFSMLFLLTFSFIFSRIVQVDLKFPTKPIISSGAKDLISQVLFSLHFQKKGNSLKFQLFTNA